MANIIQSNTSFVRLYGYLNRLEITEKMKGEYQKARRYIQG